MRAGRFTRLGASPRPGHARVARARPARRATGAPAADRPQRAARRCGPRPDVGRARRGRRRCCCRAAGTSADSPGPDRVARVLAPNRPDVLDEVFDGEAVLVNLRTGRYYALDAAATEVWRAVVAGEPLPEGSGAFAHRLVEEELAVSDGAAARARRRGPAMQVFTDMDDILLLDPIHDVDYDAVRLAVAPCFVRRLAAPVRSPSTRARCSPRRARPTRALTFAVGPSASACGSRATRWRSGSLPRSSRWRRSGAAGRRHRRLRGRAARPAVGRERAGRALRGAADGVQVLHGPTRCGCSTATARRSGSATPRRLPRWETAAPLRTLLRWALRERGLHLVHAAAVVGAARRGAARGAVGSGQVDDRAGGRGGRARLRRRRLLRGRARRPAAGPRAVRGRQGRRRRTGPGAGPAGAAGRPDAGRQGDRRAARAHALGAARVDRAPARGAGSLGSSPRAAAEALSALATSLLLLPRSTPGRPRRARRARARAARAPAPARPTDAAAAVLAEHLGMNGQRRHGRPRRRALPRRGAGERARADRRAARGAARRRRLARRHPRDRRAPRRARARPGAATRSPTPTTPASAPRAATSSPSSRTTTCGCRASSSCSWRALATRERLRLPRRVLPRRRAAAGLPPRAARRAAPGARSWRRSPRGGRCSTTSAAAARRGVARRRRRLVRARAGPRAHGRGAPADAAAQARARRLDGAHVADRARRARAAAARLGRAEGRR